MKKRKRLLLILLSLLIVICLAGTYFLQGFSTPESKVKSSEIFNAFYNEEKNSLDGVYIGPSAANRFWIPPLAFKEQGIAVSLFSTPSQPLVLTKYMLQEAKKTQDPELFIVELHCSSKNANYATETTMRYATDNLKPSLLRFKAINETLEYISLGENKVAGSSLAAYFPALESLKRKINGKLTEDVHFKISKAENPVKGYRITDSTFVQEEVRVSVYTEERLSPMASETEAVLNDLLNYCDSIDNEVLFVLAPYSVWDSNYYGRLNTAIQTVESRGYKVLNFNTKENLEKVDVNWETDYYDELHMNCIGAEKYTSYLAQYLKDNYNLEDHRNDPAYDSWHKSWNNYVDMTTEGKSMMRTN